jgi:hypothetical protein
MWLAPASVSAFLPHVVRAAQAADFTGLMVILARSADAERLQWELTDQWTSIHDVTGHLIAVLCPQPATAKSPISTFTTMSGHFLRDVAQMHDLNVFPLGPGYDAMAWALIKSVDLHSAPGTRIDGHSYAEAPFAPEKHHVAWTEATSRCATYFGVPESDLPAVLMLSFSERTALLLSLRPDSTLSLYRLCKQIAENLGYTKRAAELYAESEGLARAAMSLEYKAGMRPGILPPTRDDYDGHEHERFRSALGEPLSTYLDDRLRAQYAGLDQHLQRLADVNPTVVARWRTQITGLQSSGTVEEALRCLLAVLGHVRTSEGKREWMGLNREVHKVLSMMKEALGVRLAWDLAAPDPIAAALNLLDERRDRHRARTEEKHRKQEQALVLLRGTQERLAAMRQELEDICSRAREEGGLAAAVERAAHRLLGTSAVETLPGRDGLADFQLRVVRQPAPRLDASTATNTISGHAQIHGHVVQARDISGGIHFHPPGESPKDDSNPTSDSC